MDQPGRWEGMDLACSRDETGQQRAGSGLKMDPQSESMGFKWFQDVSKLKDLDDARGTMT